MWQDTINVQHTALLLGHIKLPILRLMLMRMVLLLDEIVQGAVSPFVMMTQLGVTQRIALQLCNS